MPPLPEQPFHEGELRFFLSEILKASSISPTDLVRIIQERNIAPQWDNMWLPNGRSVAACQNQFRLLTGPSHGVMPPMSQSQNAGQQNIRSTQPSFTYGRPLTSDVPHQPQQYQFAPINEPRNPTSFQTATYPPGVTPDKSGKKRGRPSKAEREIREAEAAARGEVYQPTKRKPKTPRPSTEAAQGGDAEDTPGSEQRFKKQKVEAEPMGPPIGPRTGSDPPGSSTTSPGEQMQVDTPERQFKSTIPETQQTGFSASSGLLPGLREQAARADTTSIGPPQASGQSPFDAAQSSMTLQQGLSTEAVASASPREPPRTSHATIQAPAATTSST